MWGRRAKSRFSFKTLGLRPNLALLWLRQFKSEPTIVVGQYRSGASGRPHALFYGHYDVQPADPLAEWDYDPFEPQVIERDDGSKFISARGASDDKCQLRTFLVVKI